MRILLKIIAGGCYALVVLFALVALDLMFDQEEPASEKRSTMLGLLFLGLPPAVLGGSISYNLHHSHQKQQGATQNQQTERLKDAFYQLVESQDGAVTVFQFARAADVDAEAARAYLDDQAKAFNATFDVGDHSEIIYRFPV
jgi:hypothetical protein